MADRAKELRRFRIYAKKQRLDLDKDRHGEWMWSDTETAWEAWWARAEMDKTDDWPSQRVRIQLT